MLLEFEVYDMSEKFKEVLEVGRLEERYDIRLDKPHSWELMDETVHEKDE